MANQNKQQIKLTKTLAAQLSMSPKNDPYEQLSRTTHNIPSSNYQYSSSPFESSAYDPLPPSKQSPSYYKTKYDNSSSAQYKSENKLSDSYANGMNNYSEYKDVKRLPSEYSSLRQTFDSRGNNRIRDLIAKLDDEEEGKSAKNYGKYDSGSGGYTGGTGKTDFRNAELEQKFKKYSSSYDQLTSELQNTSKMSEQIKKLKDQRRKRLQARDNLDQDGLLSSSYSSSNLGSSYKPSKINIERNYDNKYDFSKYEIKEPSTATLTKEDYAGFKKKKNFDIESSYTPKYEKKSYQDYSSPTYDSKYKKQDPIETKFTKYDSKNYDPSPLSTSIYSATSISSPSSKKIAKPVEYVEVNGFILGKSLGEGKFGIVYQAMHKQSRWLCAIKKIPKQMIKSHFMEDQFVLELKLQTFLYHENIVSLYKHFDDKTSIYLVLQYMEQGTLFSQLKKTKTLPEAEVALKIKQVAAAVKYLHENQIAHRDIKPENIVLSHGVCKLCDFGWATICDSRRKTYCGTFDYAPPEILEGVEYDYTVDLWCLGVLTYELLVGQAPFYHIKREQTIKKIKNVQNTVLKYPQTLSKNAINFMDSLIKKDPKQRLSSEMLLEHPFLKYADKGVKNKQF